MDLDPDRYLFVFAHPDDDVFVAGTMRLLIERKATVHGLWLTSGDARGGRERRETELHAAMDLLGLPPESRHLLRLPNRGLLPLLDQALKGLVERFTALQPRAIAVTAYEGGHIDHDLLNALVLEAARRTQCQAALREFPLYNRSGPLFTLRWRINAFPPGGPPGTGVPLTRALIRRKHRLMWCYRSQLQDMLPFRLVLSARRLLRTGEPFRPLPLDRTYDQPPHRGQLNYERGADPDRPVFEDFRQAVARLREAGD